MEEGDGEGKLVSFLGPLKSIVSPDQVRTSLPQPRTCGLSTEWRKRAWEAGRPGVREGDECCMAEGSDADGRSAWHRRARVRPAGLLPHKAPPYTQEDRLEDGRAGRRPVPDPTRHDGQGDVQFLTPPGTYGPYL